LKDKIEKTKKVISQYKKVFSTQDGRAVLYDLMRGNFLTHSSPHVPGSDSTTFKNIGKQELVMGILHILKIDPETYLNHVAEQEGNHV
jgi:hypothetical protein